MSNISGRQPIAYQCPFIFESECPYDDTTFWGCPYNKASLPGIFQTPKFCPLDRNSPLYGKQSFDEYHNTRVKIEYSFDGINKELASAVIIDPAHIDGSIQSPTIDLNSNPNPTTQQLNELNLWVP